MPDASRTRVFAVVISNQPDAPGIETAKQRGLTVLVIPSKGPPPRRAMTAPVVAALNEHAAEWVCLAGYMRLLSPWFCAAIFRSGS